MQEPNTAPDVFGILSRKGFVAQSTAGMADAMDPGNGQGITAYAGFDATANALHAGHLVVLMALRHMALAGHRVIVLLGGATTMIGDPSFRSEGRPLLSPAETRANISGIKSDVERVLRGCEVTFVDNAEWMEGAGFLDFMREVGSKFTVARMSAMEAMKSRIGNGVTMMEFSYMMLQAWDFVQLNRRFGCTLQVGGSDQWGNICNGVDLARKLDGTQLHGLTVPLLTGSGGTKMGKTADGAVWLSPSLMPARDFWQFWRNITDEEAARLFRMFGGHDGGSQECPDDPNTAKTMIAGFLTRLVHGDDWEGKSDGSSVAAGPDGAAGLLASLVSAGLSSSNSDARRSVEAGACRVDGQKVTDSRAILGARDAPYLLEIGKRRSREVIVSRCQ